MGAHGRGADLERRRRQPRPHRPAVLPPRLDPNAPSALSTPACNPATP